MAGFEVSTEGIIGEKHPDRHAHRFALLATEAAQHRDRDEIRPASHISPSSEVAAVG
jgi:hypothetical protein